MRRHDLVTLSPNAWHALLKARPDIAEDRLAAQWGDRGWPLVVRRFLPGETQRGVPLGLPLPPSAGKRRFAIWMAEDDVVAFSQPPRLDATVGVAPSHWRPTLDRVAEWAERQEIEVRVFGSLAWTYLTGLAYIGASSDVDLLLSLPVNGEVDRLTAYLSEIESSSPMRLDGEFVRQDGAGVNWKELHAGRGEILLKTQNSAELVRATEFVRGASPQ